MNANRNLQLVQSVEDALGKGTTYLIGNSITIADIAVFDAMGGGTKVHPCAVDLKSLGPEVGRWFKLIENNPATAKTRHLLCGINGNTEFPAEGVLDPLVSGCHMLEVREGGRGCGGADVHYYRSEDEV